MLASCRIVYVLVWLADKVSKAFLARHCQKKQSTLCLQAKAVAKTLEKVKIDQLELALDNINLREMVAGIKMPGQE
jgi:hypothetical protein